MKKKKADSNELKICAISDSHCQHDKIDMPSGDIVIFAGDFMGAGYDIEEVEDFAQWYGGLNFKYKIAIAGNHDRIFDDEHMADKGYEPRAKECEKILEDAGIIYLNETSVVIENIRIYGVAYQPAFCGWAFNRERGEDIKKHWDKIKIDTDILVTHSPCRNILDRCPNGFHAGCDDLLDAVKRIKPKFHVTGHIHLLEGMPREHKEFGVHFINAAVLDDYYRMKFKPRTFTYERR